MVFVLFVFSALLLLTHGQPAVISKCLRIVIIVVVVITYVINHREYIYFTKAGRVM